MIPTPLLVFHFERAFGNASSNVLHSRALVPWMCSTLLLPQFYGNYTSEKFYGNYTSEKF